MAVSFTVKTHYDIYDLLEIMRLLRSEDGCPWDREQTHQSLKSNLLEETHEALEAIEQGDSDGLQEELGDVLLQVVFHAQIEQEAQGFDFESVVDTLCKKLVTRHPHVFGDVKATDAGQALKNWDAVKRQSKNNAMQTQLLQSVPRSLPALMRAGKVLGRAKRVGFETATDALSAINRVEQQVAALKAAVLNGEQCDEQTGKALFAMTALAKKVHVDPEEALSTQIHAFIERFSAVEKQLADQGKDVADVSADEWQMLWDTTARI